MSLFHLKFITSLIKSTVCFPLGLESWFLFFLSFQFIEFWLYKIYIAKRLFLFIIYISWLIFNLKKKHLLSISVQDIVFLENSKRSKDFFKQLLDLIHSLLKSWRNWIHTGKVNPPTLIDEIFYSSCPCLFQSIRQI